MLGGKEIKNSKERGIFYSNREFDVLLYYTKVAPYLKNFLKQKKIATKVYLRDFFFLKRGSNTPPLYIDDFSAVNEKMLSLRKNHLKDIRQELSEKQQLIWVYFPPRKLVQFFYATNDEGAGKPIERIFIDIDRKNFSSEIAQEVTRELAHEIKKDKEFNKMLKYKIFIMWTGSSFHIYLLLNKKIDLSFYNKYLSYGKDKEESFIKKWAFLISKKLDIKVEAGHEKAKGKIILDSSNTPSGKLARAPFSLHVSKKGEIDGVAIPLDEKELSDKKLVSKLKKLTPEKVLKNINFYKKLL